VQCIRSPTELSLYSRNLAQPPAQLLLLIEVAITKPQLFYLKEFCVTHMAGDGSPYESKKDRVKSKMPFEECQERSHGLQQVLHELCHVAGTLRTGASECKALPQPLSGELFSPPSLSVEKCHDACHSTFVHVWGKQFIGITPRLRRSWTHTLRRQRFAPARLASGRSWGKVQSRYSPKCSHRRPRV
jgi:hypothetical protein